MKKALIFPLLFSILFLGGCAGYYSQNQVNGLIKQESAAHQAEINNLTQQIGNLEKTINDLMQNASTTVAQLGLPAANKQVPVPVAVSSTPVTGTVSSSAVKGKYVTYLVSKESTLKYCNGGDDNSDAYRQTITTEVESNILSANVTSGAISQANLVKQILALAVDCGQANLNSLDIKVVNGVVEIPPIDGWAGISIAMCSCIPQVEVNLLRLPGITKVVWETGQ